MQKALKLVFLTLLGAIVVSVCIIIAWFVISEPGYVTEAKSVQNKLKSSIGEEHLRAWALNMLDKYRNQAERTGKCEYPKSEVPGWLAKLGDPFPLSDGNVFASRGGTEYLTVAWICGRGAIGLEIGTTNFVDTQMNSGLYWIMASPGIYIYTPRH